MSEKRTKMMMKQKESNKINKQQHCTKEINKKKINTYK